jgi:protein-tyrosine phosphatase
MPLLTWEGACNLRDLGGLPTADGQQIRERVLVRGESLSRLTPTGRAALVAYGVHTVIDLRSSDEAAQWPSPFVASTTRPRYLNLPVIDESDETGQAARTSAESLGELYIAMLKHGQAQLAPIFQALARAEAGPVLVHCFIGKDRTGLVIALALELAGVSRTHIVEDYAASAANLQPLYTELKFGMDEDPVKRERQQRFLASPPEAMHAALAYVDEAHGGASGYLRAAGLTDVELQQVRDRLR